MLTGFCTGRLAQTLFRTAWFSVASFCSGRLWNRQMVVLAVFGPAAFAPAVFCTRQAIAPAGFPHRQGGRGTRPQRASPPPAEARNPAKLLQAETKGRQ